MRRKINACIINFCLENISDDLICWIYLSVTLDIYRIHYGCQLHNRCIHTSYIAVTLSYIWCVTVIHNVLFIYIYIYIYIHTYIYTYIGMYIYIYIDHILQRNTKRRLLQWWMMAWIVRLRNNETVTLIRILFNPLFNNVRTLFDDLITR